MTRRASGLLGAVAALLLASCSGDEDGRDCAQVVVYARPEAGGDCRAFPTPCDVPEGYVQCCGGLDGSDCLGGGSCVDDPDDTCDPDVGADCPGICQ